MTPINKFKNPFIKKKGFNLEWWILFMQIIKNKKALCISELANCIKQIIEYTIV